MPNQIAPAHVRVVDAHSGPPGTLDPAAERHRALLAGTVVGGPQTPAAIRTLMPRPGPVDADIVVRDWRPGKRATALRVLEPLACTEPEGPPRVVWVHGGGFVFGGPQAGDAIAQRLARDLGAGVVSLDYPLAPEHPFPAALHAVTESIEAIARACASAGSLVVGGDSAGGNLVVGALRHVTATARAAISGVVLAYPVADATASSPSHRDLGHDYLLTSSQMAWFMDHYLGAAADPRDPDVSPVFAADLAALPATLVMTAEFDPLRDEGEELARHLLSAGVPAECRRYRGQLHGFLGQPADFPAADMALGDAVAWISGH